MIVSPAKLEDMRWRAKLLKEMVMDISAGRVITAKEIGKTTAWLDNRIKTNDYSREDAFLLKESLSTGRQKTA